MVNGLDWQCCLAGSSETAPRILSFSIAMGADYSFEVKNIEIWVPAFFKHNNSFIAIGLFKVKLEMAIFRFDLENEISVCVRNWELKTWC